MIGSAADDSLIGAVDYWKKQGISIEFLPYRIYELGDEKYFEFFALPYDKHMNPSDAKGVMFDTNRKYDEDAIWYMMEKKRVAAFGNKKSVVNCVNPGDTVFFSHRWEGLVAAAKVKSDIKHSYDEMDASYRDVEFKTPVPAQGKQRINAMPFSKVEEIMGKSFFWARIDKRPYLSNKEAGKLVDELDKWLKKST